MHFTTILLASVALVAPTLASPQNSDQWPTCVQNCITRSAVSSQCDGDETGDALAACTCASFRGSLLISCIQDCPDDDQNQYAQTIPDSCRSELFPNATDNGGGSSSSSTAASESTSEPTTTEEDAQPSETEEEAGPSDTGAAFAMEVPAALAAGGLFAAFFL